MDKNIDETEKKIIHFLSQNKDNFITMKILASNLNVSYPTILRKIDRLEAMDLVFITKVGSTKLCKVKE